MVLAHLVDHSLIEDPAGRVTRRIAQALDVPADRVRQTLDRLVARGYATWDHNPISGRTFRAWPTPEGRAALGRGEHVGRVLPRRDKPSTAPVLPVLGPIGHLDFDPDAARARALEVAS